MTSNDIILLKYFATTENISVHYFDGGKYYEIPVAACLFDDGDNPSDDFDDCIDMIVACWYVMQMGIPFIRCEIGSKTSNSTIEQIYIPLDPARRDKHQREIMSLLNACSKRVIAMEMARNKYAITTALESANANKQYS